MDRQLTGYLILGVIALVIAGFVAFKTYHGRDRTHARRERREHAAHAREQAKRSK